MIFSTENLYQHDLCIKTFAGLELVAAELGGRKKVKKLLEPFNCKFITI